MLSLVAVASVVMLWSAAASAQTSSQLVSWDCNGTNCPWGDPVSGQAAVWPPETSPITTRLDYITSAPVYMPAASANGQTITIVSGTAGIYVGAPQGPHASRATLLAGQSFDFVGFAPGDVVSAQSGSTFTYTLEDTPYDPNSGPVERPDQEGYSQWVTWTCAGVDCPWGSPISGEAVVWPAIMAPLSARYDYVTDRPVYLTGAAANGKTFTVLTGVASMYVGTPGGPHQLLALLGPGESHDITSVVPGEVLSVQGGDLFTYTYEDTSDLPDPGTGDPPPFDGVMGSSTYITWTCGTGDCPWGTPVTGEAIVWPVAGTPISMHFEYEAVEAIYLPGDVANGMTIRIESGTAGIFVASSLGTDEVMAWVGAGESFVVSGLAASDYMSVESDAPFGWTAIPAGGTDPVVPPPGDDPVARPDQVGYSQVVTWTCGGAHCPWGPSSEGEAAIWEPGTSAGSAQYHYTADRAIYLPDDEANGMRFTVLTGTATLYAGELYTAHRAVATLRTGQHHDITEVAFGEMLSVQGDELFTYSFETTPFDPDPDPDPSPYPGPPGGEVPFGFTEGASQNVDWTCQGANCPWGPSASGQTLVWPLDGNASDTRHDYLATQGVYLQADYANGMEITINSGVATLFVAKPNGVDDIILALYPGESHVVSGLTPGEYLSVESDAAFTYSILPIGPGIPLPPGAVESLDAWWYCDTPGCNFAPWRSTLVGWPDWAAYPNNARPSEQNSRHVYDENGDLIYGYMGPWADGCEVTAEVGLVLIIEWERGQDIWRETYITAGETHTIALVGPENGALIETSEGGDRFAVTLNNCEPQQAPPDPLAP